MSEWYYSKGNQQIGPVSGEQLQELVSSGRVLASDLVWKEGMGEWMAAGRVSGMFGGETQSAGEVAKLASALSYYNPTGGLASRVQQTLRGFPPFRGMQNEWPLSDVQLGQLKEAEANRKHIRNLASLFQLFFILALIVAPLLLVGALFALSSNGRRANEEGMQFLFSAVIAGAFSVLWFFAARETKRCRIWPAIVFIILISMFILVVFGSFFVAMSSSRFGSSNDGMIIAPIIWCILPGAILFMCIKVISAVPKFLACPVWAQEALVNAKL